MKQLLGSDMRKSQLSMQNVFLIMEILQNHTVKSINFIVLAQLCFDSL